MNHHFHPEMNQFPPRHPQIYSLQSQFHNPTPSSDERRLSDEVIYLHSLWLRGPPPPNPHLPKPSSKRKRTHDSGKEWPVDPVPATSSPPTQGWGSFGSTPTPKFQPPSSQEQDRVLSVRVHLRGLGSSVAFFCNSDDEDDDDGDEEEYDEEEAFELFMKVFDGDEGLRGYYKSKFDNGDFYCLVCGVIGNELGRKYRDCVALVQHSVSISKTKKRIAHRAYGRVVCKVLGWDIDCLPSLPLNLTPADANQAVENQSLELEKSSDPPQGESKNNVDDSEGNPALVEGVGEPAITNDSGAEPASFPETVEKENVGSMENKCTTNQQKDSEDNVRSQSMNEIGTIITETQ